MNGPRLALALVLALSVFFRFFGLERKLLWHDEMATRVFAAGYTVDEWKAALFTGEIFDVADVQKYQHVNPEKSVAGAIRDLAENDPQHPPLYYVLARVWVVLFGDRIGTLRALSALISLASLAAVWWLALELFASRRVAWMAVALVGVSPFFVLYAQEAREYALWAALLLLSNASLLRAIRLTHEEPRLPAQRLAPAWALYSLCTVLSLYTSFTTAAAIIAQLIYLVLRERGRPTRVAVMSFVALAVAALAFLPWAVTLLHHFEAFQISMKWSKVIVIPRAALLRILGQNASRTISDFGLEIDGPLAWTLMLSCSALLLWALAEVIRRAPRHASTLLVLLVVVPIGMLLGPDLLWGGIRSLSMRYLMPAWIAALLALAYLFASERPEPRYWKALPAAVFALAIASTAVNAPKVAVWTKSTSIDLPQVADAINAAPAPALVVGNLERHNPGNLMALSILLKAGTKMQFLDSKKEEVYVLPREYGSVFLYTPIPEYRRALEEREHMHTEKLLEDTFLDLWRVEPDP